MQINFCTICCFRFLLLEQKTNSLLDHPLLIKKGTAAMNKLELFIALDIAENSNIVVSKMNNNYYYYFTGRK